MYMTNPTYLKFDPPATFGLIKRRTCRLALQIKKLFKICMQNKSPLFLMLYSQLKVNS